MESIKAEGAVKMTSAQIEELVGEGSYPIEAIEAYAVLAEISVEEVDEDIFVDNYRGEYDSQYDFALELESDLLEELESYGRHISSNASLASFKKCLEQIGFYFDTKAFEDDIFINDFMAYDNPTNFKTYVFRRH